MKKLIVLLVLLSGCDLGPRECANACAKAGAHMKKFTTTFFTGAGECICDNDMRSTQLDAGQ